MNARLVSSLLLAGALLVARHAATAAPVPLPETLLAVDINPESRVKVSAPETPLDLTPGLWEPYRIQVRNESGTTAPLRVSEAEVEGVPSAPVEWRLEPEPESGLRLSGAAEEERTLWIRSPRSGRYAASLRFDVGQGTEDLGFRAEADLVLNVGATAQDSPAPQPQLAAAGRVRQALEAMGEPLSPKSAALLDQAGRETNAERAAALVQEALDPLCLAEVRFARDGRVEAVPGAARPVLQEQGWRTFLIKVRNFGGATGPLRVSSPSARPVPNGPADEVPLRWMELSMADGRPLSPNLSGIELEYRILQVYSRDPGARTAALTYHVARTPAPPPPPRRTDRPQPQTPPDEVASNPLQSRFTAEPSHEVRFRVKDERGRPAMACFVVRDRQGRVYPSQAKRLAPDFFFHAQVYRGDGETLRLPKGTYTVRCNRGPESVPETKELVVGDGPAELRYQVKRWIDPTARGWFSGDHHIHAAGCAHYTNPTEGVLPEDMARHIQGEDLKVGANLTWGPCFDYQKQFFTGTTDRSSSYPYLLRYDIEVSGFGSHQSGHLCLLLLKDQMYPGGTSKTHWPTLGLNTLKWAKAQGAITGPAHSGNGLAPTAQRVEGPDGPNGLPSYAIPAYNGIGALEFIVDITHNVPGPDGKPVPAIDFISTMDTNRSHELNMWYHALNAGFRTRASGETDFPCISGERVGLGRVYVKQNGRLTYDEWCEGIRDGRSYVSDGYHHLMDFQARADGAARRTVQVGVKGSELRLSEPGKVRLKSEAAAWDERGGEVPVELIVNGYPVARQMLARDGKERTLEWDTRIDKSSWVAVRMFPGAHTNPIWVTVEDKPVRASRRSVEWCLRGVDQCWKEKERTYAPAEKEAARLAYEHARNVYRRLLTETPAAP